LFSNEFNFFRAKFFCNLLFFFYEQFIAAQWMKFNLNWLSIGTNVCVLSENIVYKCTSRWSICSSWMFSLPFSALSHSSLHSSSFLYNNSLAILAQPGNKCYETFSCCLYVTGVCSLVPICMFHTLP
jgi:hypothetical protein